MKGAKKKAWDSFSKYIRTRDCIRTTGILDEGVCVTCGKTYALKLLQAGHFIIGRHNAILFDEEATHAQCYNCNINLKGNLLKYRRKIIEMYGDGFDMVLEDRDKITVQYKEHDYLKIAEKYKKMTEQLTKSNG